MAKRSQRRLSRQERDQAGCIWGLINIFHFRHGRTTKRLLADRRRTSKQAVGAGNSSNQTIILGPAENCEKKVDDEESKMPMADVAKTSVKELMEEEMISENQSKDSESALERSDSGYRNHPKKHQKKRNRSRIKSGDVDVTELDPENSNRGPLDNLDLEKIMEELAEISQRNSDLDLPSDQAVTAVEEKLVTAVKLFTEQRLSSSKRFGEEFMDALQTLSSNKGLFLKLLQDPNSNLVEHVQDLQDAQLGGDKTSNISEEVNVKVDESSGRKTRNFFRRRSRSMESYPLVGDKDSNKIVILKPGPAGIRSPGSNSMVIGGKFQSGNIDDKVHNERNPSQFSFTEIKRKLRNAIGKETQGVSPDRLALKYSPKHQTANNGEKGGSGDNFSWSSPNRNHKFTERFLMSSPSFKKDEKLKDVNETCRNPKFVGANIYIEAKKHLSEMLKNGDENTESMTGQLPKSLGRILSLPEYNGSPSLSPRKFGDDIFITAQMRLSPRGIVKNDVNGLPQESHYNLQSPRRQNSASPLGASGSNSEEKVQSPSANGSIPLRDDPEHSSEIQSVTQDAIVSEAQGSPSVVVEIEQMMESGPHEEKKIINSSLSSENLSGDIEKEVTGDDTEEPSPFFKSPLFGENTILSSPTASPPHCRPSNEVEDSDCAVDKMERPSPVSVLEPLFTDDDISPASTISQPVEKEIQPRHIHFEEQTSPSDQGVCTRISLEDEESAFEYVEAVLLGSGLNWDEFLLRWISMYEILDPSLFDEVELFSSRPRHDQKLLFDCANEALTEVCETYFSCFTGISHVKLNIQTAPKGMNLIQEIWQRVERLLLQYPQPHSLDQLVKTDLARSRKWMSLQSEIEFIVSEMGETIFVELVEEIVADDTSECGFLTVLQDESNARSETSLIKCE